MNNCCKKCNIKISYPNRPFALIEDDIYCSQICFDFFYKSKQSEIENKIDGEEYCSHCNSDDHWEGYCRSCESFSNWKGGGFCSYCNSECNPASQTCGRWPNCY